MKKGSVLAFIASGALVLPVFTACKSDEPAGGDDANKAVLNFDGDRLTSVDNFSIEYDNQGRVVEIDGRYDDLEIDYSKGKIEMEDEEGNIKFNKSGYITEISMSWDETEEGYGYSYQYKGNGTAKFSYDSNGHLTSMSYNSKETEKDLINKETSTWETSSTTTLKWSNGNLTSVKMDGWEKEDGDKESYKAEISIQYGSQVNKYQQFPLTIANFAIGEEPVNILAAVGLFGKGTAEFPTQLIDYEDGDTYTINISFDLNSNGSIRNENGNYGTYSYGYSSFSTKGLSELNDKKLSLRKLFVNRDHRK